MFPYTFTAGLEMMRKHLSHWLFLAAVLYTVAPGCAVAQAQRGNKTDTLYVRNQRPKRAHLAPSFNVGVFAQIGNRTCGCEDYTGLILNGGALIKADVFAFNRGRNSVFLRAAGSLGILNMLEAGAGIFVTPNLYLSASYADLRSPDCFNYQMAPLEVSVKLNEVRSSLMLAAGYGRHGFLVELDMFFFSSYERFEYRYYAPVGYTGDFTKTGSTRPTAFSIRIGYSI